MKSLANRRYPFYMGAFLGIIFVILIYITLSQGIFPSISHLYILPFLLIGASTVILIKTRRTTNQWRSWLPVYVLLLAASLAATALLFAAQNQLNLEQTWLWINKYPYRALLSAVLLFHSFLFIFALSGSYYVGTILTMLVLSLLAITSYLKLKILGHPLYWSDFEQIREVQDLLPMVIQNISFSQMIIAIVFLQLLFLLKKKLPAYKPQWVHRLLLLGLSGFVIWSYAHYQHSPITPIFKAAHIEFIKWDPVLNYNENGAPLGFVLSLNQELFEKPEGYTKKNLIKIAEGIVRQGIATPASATPSKKPNIIYMMNEAFWDPTRLPNVTFSKDPLPYVREMLNQHTSGYALSPMFGGGTANVEFEALTGFSLSFLEHGSVPYVQMFDGVESMPTIATVLRQQGYKAVALHPFEKYFFERNVVYPKLGFQSFISMKEMKYKEMAAEHVSNMSVSKELLDLIKQETDPIFVHTVTMQNHFPFLPTRFPTTEIQVSGLNTDKKKALEVYTEGVRQSSEALQYLMTELEKLNEPTVVVFWGDHLPTFSEHNSLYQDAGFVTGKQTLQDERNMHETPFFIAANFPLPTTKLGTVSPIFFNPLLLQMLQEPLPPYYQFLTKLYERYHGLIREVKINSKNEIMTSLTKEEMELLEEYRLLQYDLLVGKQYTRSLLFPENK